MFLFTVVVLAAFALGRGPLLDRLLLGLVAFPAVFQALNLAGLTVPYGRPWVLGALAAAGCAAGLAWRARPAPGGAVSGWREAAPGLALFALSWAAWEVAYRKSFVLPAFDPLAVPTFARYVALDGDMTTRLRAGDAAFRYPPGFPALVSVLFDVLPPVQVLSAFKHLNLLVVAALPVIWAVYVRRLFFPEARGRLLLLLCFALAFYGVDRTLVLALPYAGKNAQLLAGLLFPFVVSTLVEAPRSLRTVLTAALACAGLVLLHYASLYMLLLAAAAYFLVQGHRCLGVRQVGAYAATGVLAAALFGPVILQARATGLQLSAPDWHLDAALRELWAMATSPTSPVFFIFTDVGMPWPYKQYVLLAGVLAALAVARRVGSRSGGAGSLAPSGVRDALLVHAAILCLALVLAAGVIPRSGINADYVRWFLFFFLASLFGLVAFALCAAVEAPPRGPIRNAAALALGGCAAMALLSLARDFRQVRVRVAEDRVDAGQLTRLQESLMRLAAGRECLLVTESRPVTEQLYTQMYRPLEFAEALTGCRILNGSWLRGPVPEGRGTGDKPSPAALARVLPGASVLLLTTPEQATAYASRVPGFALRRTGADLGPLQAWQVEAAPSARSDGPTGRPLPP